MFGSDCENLIAVVLEWVWDMHEVGGRLRPGEVSSSGVENAYLGNSAWSNAGGWSC
jgi:hypothetical protein